MIRNIMDVTNFGAAAEGTRQIPPRASGGMMGKSAGACRRMPASIHGHNLCVSHGQSHCAFPPIFNANI